MERERERERGLDHCRECFDGIKWYNRYNKRKGLLGKAKKYCESL